jgi:hypothetical protein
MRAAQPYRIPLGSSINNLIVDAKMDSHVVLHTYPQSPGTPKPAGTLPALISIQSPVFSADFCEISTEPNNSWFGTKDHSFTHTKEEPISPILQDSDSEETISSSESQRQSSHGNSFGSIARDASFLELYTEMVDALTPPKMRETVCEVRRVEKYMGLVRNYVCEVSSGTEKIEFRAQRQLSLGSVYKITTKGGQVASIKEISPGVFTIHTEDLQVEISFRAKEINGQIYRLAEVKMPTNRLTACYPHWNADLHTYTLDYTSQQVQPSSRNFQLTFDSKVVFQLGKVAGGRFDLRFQWPLNPILGFALAVCSLEQSNH